MNILQEAEKIIYGNRENDYGRPESNLGIIADLWTAALRQKGMLVEKKKLIHTDVALLMMLLKCARLINNIDHHDSLVDVCGYAAIVERILENIKKDNPVVSKEFLEACDCGDI